MRREWSARGGEIDRAGNSDQTTPRITEYAYDALGRTLWRDDDDGFLTFFNYDLADNVVNTADEQGWVTTFLYDALSRMREIEDPNQLRTTFLYDQGSNLTRQIDASGQPTDFVYDGLDRVSTEKDGNNHVTTSLFDPAGHLTAVIDPNANRTDFGYDADGRLAWRRDTLQHLTTYAYYATGLRQSVTDGLHRCTDYTYNADGQVLTEKWYAANGTLVETLTFTYEQGNLKTAANSQGGYTFTYDYDDNGVLRSVQEPFGLALTFTYDETGNRTQIADSLGGVTSSLYDPDNRLLRRSYSGPSSQQARIDLAWTDDGMLDTLTRYSNLDGAANHKVGSTAYGYFEDNRLSYLTHKNAAGTALVSYVFGYDRDRLQTETVNGVTTTYSYDNADQVTGDGTATYGYDPAGNRNVGGYQPGPANRMVTDGIYTFAYDDEGNLSTRIDIQTGDLWYFHYDHHNHLTKVEQWHLTDLVPDYEIQEVTFKYDAFGNRLEKSVSVLGGAPVVQRFAYDGWKTRLDVDGYDETADAVGNENWDVWADLDGNNQLVTRRLYLDAVDSVFARIGADGATAWYLPDRLGSIRDLVDNTGAVRDHLTYNAFGVILAESNPSFGDDLKYATYRWDKEIGWYEVGREYDPFTGRFASVLSQQFIE